MLSSREENHDLAVLQDSKLPENTEPTFDVDTEAEINEITLKSMKSNPEDSYNLLGSSITMAAGTYNSDTSK